MERGGVLVSYEIVRRCFIKNHGITLFFKGDATYYSLPDISDMAWSYERPNNDTEAVAGRLAFVASKVKEDAA